jgi:NhaA family Na+:H+ antiporter
MEPGMNNREYIEYIKNRPVVQVMESFVKWGASAALMLLIAAIAALILLM